MVKIGASDSRERLVADSQFGAGVITIGGVTFAPATWYCGLSTTTPNDDGTSFNEPVGGAYARVAMTNNTTNFPAATTVSGETTKRNGTKITWPNPTGTWGSATHYGWFTTASGGTPEYTNQFDSAREIRSGNTPVEIDVAQMIMPWS